MRNTSKELKPREQIFAAEYRGLQNKVSQLSSEPQPPCFFCTDNQIWRCSRTGEECDSFMHYSNCELPDICN